MSENNTLVKKQDINVELLRLIACLMVIVIHVRPLIISNDGQIMETALLCQTLAAPAVGIFFMITGFFAPKSQDFIKTWKRCVTGILLPALALVVVTNILDQVSFDAGFFHSLAKIDYAQIAKNIFEGIIGFDAAKFGNYNAHLWYIFSHILIMLFLPVMCVLAKYADRRVLWFFTILINYRLILIDIVALYPFPIIVYLPTILPAELGVFIIGYMLYSSGKHFRDKKYTKPVAAVLLIITLVTMFFAQYKLFSNELLTAEEPYELNYGSPYFLSWSCGLAVIASSLVCILVLSLHIRNERLCRLIKSLGGLTFPVYLVHFPIWAKLSNLGIISRIYGPFSASGMGVMIYTALMTIGLFLISALVSLAVIYMWRSLKRIAPKRSSLDRK